jgi:probable DNA repair protein
MGDLPVLEIDAWLRSGGLVVAASERAARALAAAYHRTRRAEGKTAWPAPGIRNWEDFARDAWEEQTVRPGLLLNALQERTLWAGIIAADGQHAALLDGPLDRMASMALEAHRLVCLYAPQFLRATARAQWQQDAGAFSGWLVQFDEICRAGGLLSPSRLPLELIEALKSNTYKRPPLLLAGFDRILPTQRKLLDAWGDWREPPRDEPAAQTFFHQTADEKAELAACALWCKRRLAVNPKARVLVVAQDAAERRGEIERAFLRFAGDCTGAGASRLFEFSLGIPLKQVSLARSALLLLHWLEAPLEEHELDWLFSVGQSAANEDESRSLAAFMRALRRRGLERTRWRFEDFCRQRPGEALPAGWVARIAQAKARLADFAQKSSAAPRRAGASSPIAWAELVPQLLQFAGWPGGRALTSTEFQTTSRWQQAVEACASLGFDGRRIEWKDFLKIMERNVSETLFAPESQDAPVLIAGPAESAGLSADAIWFMGANEDAWPAAGAVHPLLPLEVQRSAKMPHASAQLDWDLAQATTERLLSSAPEIHFSYARHSQGVETRPSRLIVKAAGAPQLLDPDLTAPPNPDSLTALFGDHSRIPFLGGEIRGGSAVLTAQSQCAFKAFATARLGAQGWKPAEAGLSAAQRGKLLHAVLHTAWSGPPHGIRSHAELINLADLGAFVAGHVRAALEQEMPPGARERMPRRYLELEETRLIDLITEWLRYEATRAPFLVQDTEVERDLAIAGLALRLRLDRVDRLADGSFLVIDYKTGDVSQKLWEMPRPDDVQLPVYAGFALNRDTEPLGGLLFAKVRAGDRCFAGRMFDAKSQLLPDAGARVDLVKKPLGIEELATWRDYIEKLAQDFLSGRADVDPREYPSTCERCGLQTICRVHEIQGQLEQDSEEGSEADDA